MKSQIAFALLLVLITSVSLANHNGRRVGKRHVEKERDQQNDPLNQNFVLTFQHASRDGVRQESNKFKVQWNGKTIKEWTPKNYEIHTESWNLQAQQGKNSLHFIGTGISDSLGQLVDNIKLERNTFCGYQNVIINGGFEEGHNLGHGWRIFKNGELKGWSCRDYIQVGWGRVYNRRWPAETHVCELDANSNSNIFQQFTLDKWLRLEK